MTPQEMRENNKRVLRGEEPSKESVNKVENIPSNYIQWLNDNEKRIETAKTLPYFLRDNGKITDKGYVLNESEKQSQTPQKLSILERAKLRHEARTPEYRDNILNQYQIERQLIRMCPDSFTDKERYVYVQNVKELAKLTGVPTSTPMTFVEADSGNANPNVLSGGGYIVRLSILYSSF